MADHEIDKHLEARLFQLLEDQGHVRLGQLVLLRRRSRTTGVTLLHVAVNARLIDDGVAASIAEAVGLPSPTAPPDAVGDEVDLGSADLEPVTAEKLTPGLLGTASTRSMPILRPPPIPPRARNESTRPLDLPKARPVPLARPIGTPGPRNTVELLPPADGNPGRQTMRELSPEEDTGPVDVLDDSFDEMAPPVSIRTGSVHTGSRETLREDIDVSWRDTEPPSGVKGAPEAIIAEAEAAVPEMPAAAERYALGEELGRGGMGQVLAAQDLTLERPVALKMMIEEDDPALTVRFVDEARVTGQLQHPSVPPVYELGRLGDGRMFFAMKRIEGRTLRDIIEELRDGTPEVVRMFGRVRLLNVFARICRAIAYAHNRGVMHRDLKPDNIMLGEFGEVTVMDWGLAKPFDSPERPGTPPRRITKGRFSTQAGDVTGTPHYMPPEQARGDVAALGPHSDIYSLGALLYELLTLEPPFDGPTARAIRDLVLEAELVPPSRRTPERSIPHEIEQLCLHCMRKQSAERPRSAAWVADRIEEFLEGEQDRARKAAERIRLETMGQQAAEQYRARAEEQQKLQNAAAILRARTSPWAPEDAQRAVWAQEDAAQAARLEAARALSTALAAYHAALGVDGDHPPTKAALAGLYYGAFVAAEQDDDRVQMAHYETLVEAFDSEAAYTALLKGDGQLEIGRLPKGLKATLFAMAPVDRIERPCRPQVLARTPVRLDPIPMGSYLLELSGPGLQATPVPVYISRGERLRLRLRLFPDNVVGEGFVHIAGGPARLGGDPVAQLARPATVMEVDDFFLARRPITGGEYLVFLNDLAEREGQGAAIAHAPRMGFKGPPLWPVGPEGRLVIPDRDAMGHAWHANWPMVSISANDADAYCAWLTQRTGERHRLPTEVEWEKAARGADGRLFPWGDQWEPTFCHMGISREGPPDPNPLEGDPVDVSPYGVRAMAGGVSEWTGSWLDEASRRRVVKGGHWASSPVECRAASRFGVPEDQVSPTVGFRVARDAPG